MRNFLPDPNGGSDNSGSEDEEFFFGVEEGVDIVMEHIAAGAASDSDVQQQDESDSQQNDDTGPSPGSPTNNNSGSASPDNARTAEAEAEAEMVQAEGNWYFSDSDEEEKKATVEQVFEVEPSFEGTREQPPDIEVGAEVIDVKFHPSKQLIAVATLDSEVIIYRYSMTDSSEMHGSEHHDAALRSIVFSKDGNTLYSASKDQSVALLDTETFKIKKHYKKAHTSSVYSLCSINNNLFASGDDDGILKVWDVRRDKAVYEFRCGEETVNSMIVDDSEKTLVVAVADGSIAAFNLSKKKLIVQSELYDHPLTCMAIVRNGTRMAVGSDNGDLRIFNWGEFGYHMDYVSEQPEQINCMEAVGDNRVITGCEDGYIRAINLYPHQYVGVVGRHMQYGVEAISISCDQKYLASCCQTDTVQFWDLQHLYATETDERKKLPKSNALRNNLPSARERNATEFFTDMAADGPSDDESDDESKDDSQPTEPKVEIKNEQD